MIYALLLDTAPILHAPVAEFDFANPPCDPVALAADLRETMLAHRGFGLAANQCGLPHRVFVLDDPNGGDPLAFFNPKIEAREGEIERDEGCLTYPGLYLQIKRAAVVTVLAQNERGEPFEITLADMHARGAEHETDHLDGTTFIRKVSRLKLDRARKKMQKP